MGNNRRLKQAMCKAADGKNVTIAFIGGSITQGSLASRSEFCYQKRVANWWRKTYPKAEIKDINAGIGGTTSHFGTARVTEDVLNYCPDVVFVEFSVNDEANDFFMETYEGLLRRILNAENAPAVVLIHNVRYDTGGNAQVFHAKVGRYYDLPSVSMQNTIFQKVVSGELEAKEITEDNLHPNDYGHQLVAEVITDFLADIHKNRQEQEMAYEVPKTPLTINAYENARRINAKNCAPEDTKCDGFAKDNRLQQEITDVFKNGWMADREGAKICFRVTGSEIAIQYRKTIQHPAPVAEITIDNGQTESVLLDANFEETWGDCLYLQPVLIHGENKEHTIEIKVIYAPDKKIPFYLNAVIVA